MANNGNGVTYDEVIEAAKRLQAEGETPNVKNIRKITKTGSYSTIGKYLKQYIEETRLKARLSMKLSDAFYTNAENELAKQLEIYDQRSQEIRDSENRINNECLEKIEEMETEIAGLEEKVTELQDQAHQKEVKLHEVSISSNHKISAMETRLEELLAERDVAVHEKTAAVREVDKANMVIEKMKESQAKQHDHLIELTAELKEIRKTAEQHRTAAVAAETEVKGRDKIIADLASREKDAVSRHEHLAQELQAEKERNVRLAMELEAIKQQGARDEFANQKPVPEKTKSRSLSRKDHKDHPLLEGVDDPLAS